MEEGALPQIQFSLNTGPVALQEEAPWAGSLPAGAGYQRALCKWLQLLPAIRGTDVASGASCVLGDAPSLQQAWALHVQLRDRAVMLRR